MNTPLIDIDLLPRTPPMPVLFIGHGSPMNTLEDNVFTRSWEKLATELPRPAAILCVSAHWETDGVAATAQPWPQTIHDFHGFPDALYAMQYKAPGAPAVAGWLAAHLGAQEDLHWGLDHGTWSVLCRLYPQADIPVLQLSLDRQLDSAGHYRLGQQLAPLRERGVLILGSGNIVHNLRLMTRHGSYPWADQFDQYIASAILRADHDAVVHYARQGDAAQQSVNSAEHFLPLLYVLGAAGPRHRVSFPTEGMALGSLSMRSVRLDAPHP
ncbi:extradiol ring-cleavage dioxygenase class III protein subunit B [Alcanivorax sp. S71-1-4]|uniref:4,5-DOPA-extradiol-dioxygenase n=1 Tax=Alcanivorax sp. S71-1-4 TaxID=1177159 RepID=UPI00169AC4AD|nr:4,5-DOPA dioxygenase extradiol [Alcanivorax sp. S71-1-4]KAF0809080.1 extradiol ring-cleavage dioxygenase class III protein subunit B [Alcanivorax sp. S71-1-4]